MERTIGGRRIGILILYRPWGHKRQENAVTMSAYFRACRGEIAKASILSPLINPNATFPCFVEKRCHRLRMRNEAERETQSLGLERGP